MEQLKQSPLNVLLGCICESGGAEYQEQIRAEHFGEFNVDAELYRRACSPGASIGAIVFRLSQLTMLSMYRQATGVELPWLYPEPHDAVFKVLATVPMAGLPEGRRTIPLSEMEELVDSVQKEYETSKGT